MMSDVTRTGLPNDLGVVRAAGELLVYKIEEDDSMSLTRFGEATPIPDNELTAEMRDAVEADLVKRGIKKANNADA
ncbi:hypothetical protein J7355_15470 [Endozoicomonas sp. G2_2]|nr:hypothetical protein [Endozoicomonas sp. G2_2]